MHVICISKGLIFVKEFLKATIVICFYFLPICAIKLEELSTFVTTLEPLVAFWSNYRHPQTCKSKRGHIWQKSKEHNFLDRRGSIH